MTDRYAAINHLTRAAMRSSRREEVLASSLLSVYCLDVLILHGWKEIAAYLDLPVERVRKFHTHYGMPVHRVLEKATVAHTDALIEWLFRMDRLERKLEAEGKLGPPRARKDVRLKEILGLKVGYATEEERRAAREAWAVRRAERIRMKREARNGQSAPAHS